MIFSKPVEKKSTKGRSKPSEYEAMLRNGFILPKLNSTIVNKIYMYRVKSNLEYCPRTSDIKVYKICINPPSKEFMLGEIHQELLKRGDVRDLTYDPKHLPDVEWCVKALLALNPDHRIFEKDYVPGVNEKGRKGQKPFANFEEEDEQESFQEFEKGLPSHLHFQNQYQARYFKGNQSSTVEMQFEDDTITEKGNEENQMDVQEPINPFTNTKEQKMFMQNPNMKFSRESEFEILGQAQSKSKQSVYSQQILPKKNVDLHQTLKNLNTNLFSPNVSKNKSKKNLSSLEEEMIVNMFQKLVLNCKGRPVDFVKSYLEQYHSEKSANSGMNSTQSSNGASNENINQSAFGLPSKTKAQTFTSPGNSKNFHFGQKYASNISANDFKPDPNYDKDSKSIEYLKQEDEKMNSSHFNSNEYLDAQNVENQVQSNAGHSQFEKETGPHAFEQQVNMQNNSYPESLSQIHVKKIFNI